VLLAEDEPINQVVSRGLLEDAGFRVDLAEDGIEAVELARTHAYALILMDIQMPRLNGLDDDRQQCLEAGMDNHIAKPVDPDRLYETLLT
jgi:CheY-like chemotaxis protein